MTDSLVITKDNFENFYDILDDIGSGQFAVVKKCAEKGTGTEYAAKIMKKKRRRSSRRGVSAEEIVQEASILLKTRHEGVIYLHAVFETPADYTLVLELVSGGELFEFLAEQEYLAESEALGFTRQVVEAVHYLHDNHIVHMDIKPENIVLKDRTEKKIKLIDFGLAKIIPPGEIVRAILGTPEFVAPEVINFEPVGTPTDMWAVGVLTYILLSGASPFLGDDNNETFINVQSVEYRFDDEYFCEISEQAKDFISQLLLKNPRNRLSARDCLSHSWLKPDADAWKKRRTTLIKTDTFKAFTARERWKTSMKKVVALNRLGILGKKDFFESEGSDTSDSESDQPDETYARRKSPSTNSKLLQDSTSDAK
ncbi:death-associated protein kinase 2-like [Montipora foliosa]|uniref:death-associated protein kinase 2-like n=1 Tax=Montipora foliosa TaxID=591990 RepID=UPI0035F1CDDC